MKRYFVLLFALVVLAAIIPATQAAFSPQDVAYDTGHMGYFAPANFTSIGGNNYVNNQSEINAWCAWTGHGATGTNEYIYEWFTDNSTYGGSAAKLINQPFVSGNYPYYGVAYVCGGVYRWARVWYRSDMASNYTVASDFYATPTHGSGPLYVTLYDNSTGNPNAWSWNITPATGWYAAPTDLDNEDITIYFDTNGNYTVTHYASNGFNNDTETKTDYIWVYNASATIDTKFAAIDGLTGYGLQGAQVDLYDIQNSSWKNTTTTNGEATITTLTGHTINAYASVLGYDDGDLLAQPAKSSGLYSILMWPPGVYNVSEGNVTVFITVEDSFTHARIVGAGVTQTSGGAGWTQMTDEGGNAHFTVANNTIASFNAKKPSDGYAGKTASVNTGTGSGGSAMVSLTILLDKNTATPVITATTLPGGGTPVPTVTILPGCEDPTSDKCRQAQNVNFMDYLRGNAMSILMLCVVAMIFGLIKMIFKW